MKRLVLLAALCAVVCACVIPVRVVNEPASVPSKGRIMSALANNSGPLFQASWTGGTDMTSTLTSSAFRCGDWLSTSVHVEWPSTGSPVGAFSYQASNDSDDGIDGHWRPVSLTVDVQPSGSAGGDLVDFTSMPWRWIQAVYTPSSGGTGALPSIWFFGKGNGKASY